MKNSNYITIQGWMVNELHLSGNELLLYALIYGFSQDGETEYYGSQSYMADSLGISRESVLRTIKKLEEKGLLKKIQSKELFKEKLRYKAIYSCDEMSQRDVSKCHNRCDETSHNNIEDNNTDKKEDTNVSEKEVSWRDDFNVYLSLVNEAKLRLLDDDVFCEQMERYRPNADYDKTIEKMVEMFWGTEAGWHNKKSKRSKSIDMYSTLKKNFEKNIVYKERGQVGRVRITQNITEETQNTNLVIGGTEYR